MHSLWYLSGEAHYMRFNRYHIFTIIHYCYEPMMLCYIYNNFIFVKIWKNLYPIFPWAKHLSITARRKMKDQFAMYDNVHNVAKIHTFDDRFFILRDNYFFVSILFIHIKCHYTDFNLLYGNIIVNTDKLRFPMGYVVYETGSWLSKYGRSWAIMQYRF